MTNSGDKSSPPPRKPTQSPAPASSTGRTGGRSSRGGRGAHNAPTPVPRPGQSGGGERKRRHEGDPGAGPSVPPQQRAVPQPEEDELEGAFPCALCDMRFENDKSLAGHMRMHPDRPWRGMHPPPTFTREDFADVAHLLNPEHNGDEDDDDDDEDDENNGGGAASGAGRRNLNIPDLNKTPSPPSS